MTMNTMAYFLLKGVRIYLLYGYSLMVTHQRVSYCTLLHRSQLTWDNSNLHDFLIDKLHEDFEIKIIGIGISDKAMAFKVNIFPLVSVNKIPHITICTFNGGKPVDSNYITEWKDIEPITVEIKLEKR